MKDKSDMTHELCNWISYNRGFVTSIVLAGTLAIGFVSCAPKTDSLIRPGIKVTYPELLREISQIDAEYAGKVQAAKLAADDLRDQYQRRDELVKAMSGLAQTASDGTMTAGGIAGAIIQTLALFATGGLIYDNRRKDSLIKKCSSAKT